MAPVLFDVVQLVTPYEQFSSSQDKLVVKKKGNVRKKKKDRISSHTKELRHNEFVTKMDEKEVKD